MGFLNSLKLDVKRKAHFKCCICESFEFLHVHHIIPQESDGLDTYENAAPLCTRCHDAYGDNPKKRKWITEKRDFWYDLCENKLYNEDINQLQKTYEIIENMHTDHERRLETTEKTIGVLKDTVKQLNEQIQTYVSSIQNTPLNERPEIFERIESAARTISGSAVTMSVLGRGVSNTSCHSCGSFIGLYISNQEGSLLCPQCKTQMQ
ncbi:MAG: HNH endonuclease [Spirochaetes bacterium]|nr:HNH endonuclease [Spirochaetota bacterium]